MGFFQILRVERDEIGRFLGIDEDDAFAIGNGEFGLVAERNGAQDGAIGGVDDGGIFATAVESENALGGGIVNDGIGIRVGFCGADGLQSFEIEDSDCVRAAIAGEAAPEVGGNSNAVDAGGIGDVAFDGIGV